MIDEGKWVASFEGVWVFLRVYGRRDCILSRTPLIVTQERLRGGVMDDVPGDDIVIDVVGWIQEQFSMYHKLSPYEEKLTFPGFTSFTRKELLGKMLDRWGDFVIGCVLTS